MYAKNANAAKAFSLGMFLGLFCWDSEIDVGTANDMERIANHLGLDDQLKSNLHSFLEVALDRKDLSSQVLVSFVEQLSASFLSGDSFPCE